MKQLKIAADNSQNQLIFSFGFELMWKTRYKLILSCINNYRKKFKFKISKTSFGRGEAQFCLKSKTELAI